MSLIHSAPARIALALALAGSAVACADDDAPADASDAGAAVDTADDTTGDASTDTGVDAVGDTGDPGPVVVPPAHPHLAGSVWPTSHASPYAQGSVAHAGATSDAGAVDFVPVGFVSITMTYGPVWPDGTALIWGSTPTGVYKAVRTDDGIEVVDSALSEGRLDSLIAGAYTVLDADGVFYRTWGATLEAWSDDGDDARSSIEAVGRWTLPDAADGVAIIGLSLTWDGWLVFATSDGRVGAIDRAFETVHLVDLEPDETVSNSIAVDETGGIFVVTDGAMYRVQWTGDGLSRDDADGAWRATYALGDGEQVSGRLGAGSGSTPSLMGGPDDPHRFVVITDADPLMHLVYFWRDAIPEDAPTPPEGADPRQAAAVPVTFGDADATSSVSEQSVLVSGYRAVVVSNDYEDTSGPLAPILAGEAPLGVEQFAWDPETFAVSTTWVRDDVSCPNGIPTMSRATDTMYCVGRRDGTWTFEAFDWQTGDTRFFVPTGATNDYNSTYAATQVGLDGELITGTFGGFVRFVPE